MDPHQIYKKAEGHVSALFNKSKNDKLVFHTLQHTKKVVERTKEIAAHYSLSEKDMLVVYIAAWFHDIGYLYTDPENHEEKSVEVMKNFMAEYSNDTSLINDIEQCILSTRRLEKAKNLLQEIICDADTYHFGTKEFKETNKQVYQEEYEREGENFNKNDWNERALLLLKKHEYYTAYCKENLEDKKKLNIKSLKRKIAKHQKETGSLRIDESNSLTTKGIQTMLRLTSENHLRLSDMADNKANILISVNAIMISVILGVLMRKLQEDPYLTIPTIIFLIASVSTIVISILATRPKIDSGTFSEEDIINKKANLLFFGNFHKATFDQYDVAMRKMMKDSDYLYGSLIRDIYHLGVVLGRKYKLVRLAYYIFMIGLIASVLAFAIAVFFLDTQQSSGSSSAFPL